VRDVFPKSPLAFAPDAGPLYIYFTAYFFIIVLVAEIILFISIGKVKGTEKTRLGYVLFSSTAGFIGGGSVFLLTFNIPIPPYPLILFSLYPIIITYAILRHHLFNIKVVSAELFTFAIWGLLFSRILVSPTTEDQLITSGLLIATIISGVFLIRSVMKEIESREEIERLATDLARANDRLKELDKLKSEFVSIASHQLRSPLTAIKGYASLILDGSYGKVPPAINEAVDKMFQSCQSLVVMVEDFLNVSRIEQGRMKYEFETVDLEKIVKSVVEEQKASATQRDLVLTFSTDHLTPYLVKADISKIRQVAVNLIDNAIKYTPKGSIAVRLTKKRAERKIILSIADTGIGVDKETIPVLFAKFSRAKDANKVNVIGTGLGLYIVKEIVEGHKGRVWIESEGIGKGTTFFVELLEDSEAIRANTVTNFAKTV
jgi:signal transduction histidine kinase